MKRLTGLILILIIMLVTEGCTSLPAESSSRIARPQVKTAPLQGTWLVDECITREPGTPQKSKEDKFMGMKVGFSNNSAVFGEYLWNDVVYKIKRVNAEEYFLHRFQDAVKKLDIKEKEVYVIQVSSGEKFLYEFVKIDNDRIVANVDSNLYCLNKVSDEFDGTSKKLANDESVDTISGLNDASKELHSGIFLGLRIPQKTTSSENNAVSEEYRYQTYWIAFAGGKLEPVLAAPDIFLPRKDGFWRVKARKASDNPAISDVVYTLRISSGGFSRLISSNIWSRPENGKLARNRTILYVGNDYICFEDTYYSVNNAQQSIAKRELRTLPVDRMDDLQGVKLSDIAGENGAMAVEEAISDLSKNYKNTGVKGIEEYNLDQNFALFRKTGHWFFKGRINLGKEYPVSFTDFSLNVLPPSDMVAYDTLSVPWTIIKDRVPQAVDAYTSPNKDMALVLTRNSLLIYAINGSTISDLPLQKLAIPDGSSVVMAEWGTGNYMKNWEKAFVENNPVKEAK